MIKNIKTNYLPHETILNSNFSFITDFLIFSEIELPLGWHNHTEIIRILEGEGEFIVDGKSHKVRAGSFVIINPNQIHSATSVMGRPLKYQSLKFTYDFFGSPDDDSHLKYILPLKKGTSYLPSSIITTFPIHSAVSNLFNELDEIDSSNDIGYEIRIKIVLYKLILTFYKNKFVYKKRDTVIKENKADLLVKNTINYIHERYYEDFTLELLASTFNTSKPHLCRTFKRITNQTITEYQNNHRIKMACDLLKGTNDHITKIAFDIGYGNLSYFHSRFKSKTHTTPNEYRDIYKRG